MSSYTADYTAESSYENKYYHALNELKGLVTKGFSDNAIDLSIRVQLREIEKAANEIEALDRKAFSVARADNLRLAREILDSPECERALTMLLAAQEELSVSSRAILSGAGKRIESKLRLGFIGLLIVLITAGLIAFWWSSNLTKLNTKYQKMATESLEDLMDAQATAKIGNWRHNLLTGEQVWSSEHYRIFEISEPQQPDQLFQMYRNRIHPGDHAELDRVISQALKDGSDFSFHHRVILDDGKRVKFVLGIGKVALNEEGKPSLLYGTCQDVTDQKRMADTLTQERAISVQSSKLASLGEMAAGMAHEINNPLAIIEGNLRLLKKCVGDEAAFGAKMEIVTKAVGRIGRIVKALKRFSRTNEGVAHKVESLEGIVTEVLVLTEAKAKLHSVRVSIRVASDLKINCDSVEIEQVLINLINNGIDAIKARDEKWVGINAFSDRDQIVVQVIDSGLGVSPETEEKIFQPFFTTKALGEGTGLGLSIARGILQQHKATLAINREYGDSCFEIRFPVATMSELMDQAAA
jgi:nitrogen fixation/metabolism regulation signal transduction histidine kinase